MYNSNYEPFALGVDVRSVMEGESVSVLSKILKGGSNVFNDI